MMKFDNYPADRVGLTTPGGAVAERRHADQYARYSHQMSEDAEAAAGRVVVRMVPLLYGILLGGLSDSLPLGLALGLAVSIALDLRMGTRSMALPLARQLGQIACPRATLLMHWLAGRIEAAGMHAPRAMRGIHCGAG